MTTSRDDIKGWFDRGIAQNAGRKFVSKDFMIIVCDTFGNKDYILFIAHAQYLTHSGVFKSGKTTC